MLSVRSLLAGLTPDAEGRPRYEAMVETKAPADDRLKTAVQRHVLQVLADAGGNQREAAQRLGLSPARLCVLLRGWREG